MAVEMLTGEPLFPGDSDVDQLWLILKCMGRLPPAYAEMLSCNEYFAVRALSPCTVLTSETCSSPCAVRWIRAQRDGRKHSRCLLGLKGCGAGTGHEATRHVGERASGAALPLL